jgi:dihydropteroate synthase
MSSMPVMINNLWSVGHHRIDMQQRGKIMGIVNVTPDSFSDGGKFFDAVIAVEQGLQLVAEGADILDIGGESTRPGADPVTEAEELRRVIPVIRSLAQQTRALLSVDTFKPAVAAAALDAGAHIINDVSGFRDPAMIQVAVQSTVGLVLMHMQGMPRTMQVQPSYPNGDVVQAVCDFFQQRLAALAEAGVAAERVVFDPGIGFGKTLEHNLLLLRSLPLLRVAGRPLLIGASRKSMIGKVLQSTNMQDRHWPTVALTAWTREAGASILRVHEVKANVDALRMVEAIMQAPTAA